MNFAPNILQDMQQAVLQEVKGGVSEKLPQFVTESISEAISGGSEDLPLQDD